MEASDSLLDLVELEHEDPEMVPDIIPVDAKLSIRTTVATLTELFERAVSISPLPAKEVIPGTSYALLEAFPASDSSAAYLKITATDGDHSLSATVDRVTVLMSGRALVPPRKVLDILKSAPGQTIKVEVLGTSMTLRAGRAQWTVATPASDKMALLPDVSAIDLVSVPREAFLKALLVTRKSVAATAARAALMQSSVKNHSITSADGGRVHRQEVPGLDSRLNFSIPTKTMDELIRALRSSDSESFELGHDDYHLVFRIGQDELIGVRLLVGFPDGVDALVLKASFGNTNTLSVDRKELIEVIKRVRVNADPDYSAIFLSLVPHKQDSAGDQSWALAVQARDRSGNGAQELIECMWVGTNKPRELCLNHKYLMDLLTSYDEDSIIFKVGDDTKTVRTPLLVEDSEAGFTGLVVQMSVSWLR